MERFAGLSRDEVQRGGAGSCGPDEHPVQRGDTTYCRQNPSSAPHPDDPFADEGLDEFDLDPTMDFSDPYGAMDDRPFFGVSLARVARLAAQF